MTEMGDFIGNYRILVDLSSHPGDALPLAPASITLIIPDVKGLKV
jgi:hypothetical protein